MEWNHKWITRESDLSSFFFRQRVQYKLSRTALSLSVCIVFSSRVASFSCFLSSFFRSIEEFFPFDPTISASLLTHTPLILSFVCLFRGDRSWSLLLESSCHLCLDSHILSFMSSSAFLTSSSLCSMLFLFPSRETFLMLRPPPQLLSLHHLSIPWGIIIILRVFYNTRGSSSSSSMDIVVVHLLSRKTMMTTTVMPNGSE